MDNKDAVKICWKNSPPPKALQVFYAILRAQKVVAMGHNPTSRFSIKQKCQNMSLTG